MKPITAFVPHAGNNAARGTIEQLSQSGLVEKAYVLSRGGNGSPAGIDSVHVDSITSSQTISQFAEKAQTPLVMFVLHDTPIELGQFALQRLTTIALATGAGLVYSDYSTVKGDSRAANPLVDYQLGSIRDDFNFGSIILLKTALLKQFAAEIQAAAYQFAGWYALRLAISRVASIVRISEPLYSRIDFDARKSGEKMFDYVDPRNRAVQIEMEKAATDHLKQIGAYLKPEFKPLAFDDAKGESGSFACEASVIIPVRNRVKTIGDAVDSVLKQKTSFKFNLIVVDNHSNDGTSELLDKAAKKDDRLIHLIPSRNDLGIGGCWNEGVHHARCGRFAIQLDSDDIYSGDSTVQQIVDCFREQMCAMVVGSYRMTNFKLEEIPPGVIDHREWTPDNGRNNALRINGLGAPRAFYTPILRKLNIPNVSYGEDYAVGLAISREHQIGRIYDPLYLCRRWEGNSDADLDVAKMNTFNAYKDKVRTLEILARQQMNAPSRE